MAKRISETEVGRRVYAYVVLHRGKFAGTIRGLAPRDGMGAFRVEVRIFKGRLVHDEVLTGRAYGYGYCKLSQAFQTAMQTLKPWKRDVGGVGWAAVEEAMEKFGYKVHQVL